MIAECCDPFHEIQLRTILLDLFEFIRVVCDILVTKTCYIIAHQRCLSKIYKHIICLNHLEVTLYSLKVI